MCQIQFVKRLNGKFTERDKKEFIKLMFLGNIHNNDAFGLFNKNYSIKAPGKFNYTKINEKKIMKDNFIVGHNRFATNGECFEYPEIEFQEFKIRTNPFINLFNIWLYKDYYKGLLEINSKEKYKNYNNHPFKLKKLLLVHNGIIHNDDKLRKKYKIDSKIETDSYIILFLIDYFLNKSEQKTRREKIVDAIKQTTKKINGNYSVMLYDKLSKDLFYFRNEFTSFTFNIIGNKLIIGSTNEQNLNYIYGNKVKRNVIETFPRNIYLVGNKIEKLGVF